jgi:hypothetical protein
MIDVAVIASVPHLDDLAALGSIDMALAHLTLDNTRYADFYRQRAADGVTVILDNSAYELEERTGKGLGVEPVLEAAERIGATVVICQDVPYDSAGTLTTTRRFLTEAAGTGYQFMAVPQGTTRAEWLDCYDILATMPGIDIIGLSKLSVPRCFGGPVAESRLTCVETLLARGITSPLHLLGGDRSLPWELAEHRRRGHDGTVRSNDSSFAFWYPACGINIDAATGRAAYEATTKPDLIAGRLDDTALAAARRTARLLLTCAETGNDTRERAGR